MKYELIGIIETLSTMPAKGFSEINQISGDASTDESEIQRPDPFVLPCTKWFKDNFAREYYNYAEMRLKTPKIKITVEVLEE